MRLLTERGPLTEDEILAHLAEAGVDLGRDPEDTLTEVLEDENVGLVPLLDGRQAMLPALLDGRVLTHRLNPRRGPPRRRRRGAGPRCAADPLRSPRAPAAGLRLPLVALLLRNRPRPHPGLARNQPCWCGSGRKYKQCHLNREQLPLDDRAGWLYQTGVIYLQEGPWRGDVIDVATVRAAALPGDHPLYQALTDPLVVDAVLFEGGAFAEFLEQRGQLLPDDERLLAEQWLLVDRSLFEVEEVRPGDGLTVRDLRTGDRVEVRERSASRLLRVGDLVCARVAPAGEGHQLFGGVETIPLRMRDALLDLLDDGPGPLELVELLTSGDAPPQLQNTEGDPMVVCEATLRSGDSAALAAALDGAFQRVEGTAVPQWHEHVVTTGMQRIRASLRLDGDMLTVDANSEARMDRVLATLRSLQPSLALLRDDRQPAADLMEAIGRAPEDDTGAPAASGFLDPL